VLRVGSPPGETTTADANSDVPWIGPGDEAGARAWVAQLAGRPGVLLADDVGAPGEYAALGALPAVGARTGVALVAAASPGQLSGHYQGPIAALRRGRTGLLLCPGPGDADLLGLRLPRTPLPVRPGSGWLVTGAVMERIQVARQRPPAGTHPDSAGQSSSSAGPISCVAYQASS
jgi:S-DNA-T family DNA segregation ATPase FtsK/SpoIIIE